MNIKWNADKYEKGFSFVHRYGEAVLDMVDLPEGSRMIDLGCGNGALTAKLAEKGYDVIGIDDSADWNKSTGFYIAGSERGDDRPFEKMIEAAKKKKLDGVCFVVGDCEKLPFEENSFDVVTCSMSFHHYPNPDKFFKSLHTGWIPI